MKKLAFTAALAAILTLPVPAAMAAGAASPQGHQPVKAEVVNPNPRNFTINLKKLVNLNVNENARTFAIYTTAHLPETCGDFSALNLRYRKPDKYTRVFNLLNRPEILKALDEYGCVIIPNKPSRT